MTSNFVKQGTEIIQEAVVKDNCDDFENALRLYVSGVQYLLTALKYEKNEKVIEAIRNKVDKYLRRAEDIKRASDEGKLVKKNNDPKHKKTSSHNKHDDQKDDKDKTNSDEDNDDESSKFQKALSSAIMIEKPEVKWDDVAGLETAKQLLKEAVILPLKFPHIFTGNRRPWAAILLYGPPGTGKSYLAKAVATEANNCTFISISSSDLISKYVGESERLIKNLFILAKKKKPSIIFIDEIDSIATKRNDNDQDYNRRIKTELLVQMQGVGKDTQGILILGATNAPWDIDPAVRRRFAKRIYIPLPDETARINLFKIHIKDTFNNLIDDDYNILASRTKHFSGADISTIVQDALMEPIRTLQVATHFKKIYVKNNENNTNDNMEIDHDDSKDGQNSNNNNKDTEDYILLPCSPNDPHGIPMTLTDISEADQPRIRAEPLQLQHFIRVLANCKPTVSQQDLIKHEEWTTQFGQEG